MKQRFLHLFLTLTLAIPLDYGHFGSVVPESDSAAAKVFLNEELKPKAQVDIALVAGANRSQDVDQRPINNQGNFRARTQSQRENN